MNFNKKKREKNSIKQKNSENENDKILLYLTTTNEEKKIYREFKRNENQTHRINFRLTKHTHSKCQHKHKLERILDNDEIIFLDSSPLFCTKM